ncbi:hypothetical protein T12_13741 [Trichinella patagoniensis]|uniref:Uncharacterized protein n=1 Tax=Trichinella patagoniensis TaxID=990121 RepID=A0A0V0Z7H4_9BILA|nr:hypothetical protein T12_9098 [Trichinella patagoniensis]KRY08365.1 hypothetical protein T12_13741 [Trichinella patagoniensis]
MLLRLEPPNAWTEPAATCSTADRGPTAWARQSRTADGDPQARPKRTIQTDGSRRSSECPANTESSQMPRHLISDAYEWFNKIPFVPIYYLAKPQLKERAWQNQRGKKTLLSLTLV